MAGRKLRIAGQKLIPHTISRDPRKLLEYRIKQGWTDSIGAGFVSSQIVTLDRGKITLRDGLKKTCEHCGSVYHEPLSLEDLNRRELEEVVEWFSENYGTEEVDIEACYHITVDAKTIQVE